MCEIKIEREKVSWWVEDIRRKQSFEGETKEVAYEVNSLINKSLIK